MEDKIRELARSTTHSELDIREGFCEIKRLSLDYDLKITDDEIIALIEHSILLSMRGCVNYVQIAATAMQIKYNSD